MSEFLTEIVKGLVTEPSRISVTEKTPAAPQVSADGTVTANLSNLSNPVNPAKTVVYHLSVAESDMGRVIGKHGRIAHAIRTVMRQAGQVQNPPVHAVVEIG